MERDSIGQEGMLTCLSWSGNFRGNTQGNKIKSIGKKSRWLAGDDIVLHTLNILYYVMEARGRKVLPNLIRVTHDDTSEYIL